MQLVRDAACLLTDACRPPTIAPLVALFDEVLTEPIPEQWFEILAHLDRSCSAG